MWSVTSNLNLQIRDLPSNREEKGGFLPSHPLPENDHIQTVSCVLLLGKETATPFLMLEGWGVRQIYGTVQLVLFVRSHYCFK